LPHARLTERAGNPQKSLVLGCTAVRGDFMNGFAFTFLFKTTLKVFVSLSPHYSRQRMPDPESVMLQGSKTIFKAKNAFRNYNIHYF
jgi:hypothetical protein